MVNPINLTNFTNSNGIGDLAVAANQSTGGGLGIALLFIVFCILFVNLKPYNSLQNTLLTSLFVLSILALIFRIMLIANDYVVWTIWLSTIILLGASFFFPQNE